MVLLQYSIIVLLCTLGVAGYFWLGEGKKLNIALVKRGLAILLMGIFFVRYMSGDDSIANTFGLESSEFSSKFTALVSLIFNWFLYASILLVFLGDFFRNNVVRQIICCFVFPVSILFIIFAMSISIGIVGKAGYYSFNFRVILQSVEIALLFIYSFVVFWEGGRFAVFKEKLTGLIYILPMLLSIMPPYMLSGIWGNAPIISEVKGLNQIHRLILYVAFILPIVVYFVLRKKPKETIKLCLLYISLGTLISFSLKFKFEALSDITAWPFHLCNTAMYIIPLCLIFKWERLFYFTYFINVLGAFFALIMPNYSSSLDMFSSSLVLFYINHYIAFFMPILMVALGVYARPRLRTFLYSITGFAMYFVFILIINAWFSNFASVDYFFVNSDFIAEKLGRWAANLRNIVVDVPISGLIFRFYPLYQGAFFLVYSVLGLGMWFVYEWIYSGVDLLYEISNRRQKIHLDTLAMLSEKKMEGQVVSEIKLELINFSKKYQKNTNFSVKDASLEVKGGEIFGFLGPNGAGKSTIIKCVVGIQPITDGQIKVCGYDVEKESTLAKSEIGFVPDHYALYENLTGREYINYIADLYGVSDTDRNERIEKYVKMFELSTAFDNQMKTYSHGMKQKIAIMSALVHNPKIWILDEPLTGLDPNSIFQVKKCMKEHANAGNVVFFSSHIIDVVERICDRIAIIKKGTIEVVKDVKEIEISDTLENFYMKTINSTKHKKEKDNEKDKVSDTSSARQQT